MSETMGDNGQGTVESSIPQSGEGISQDSSSQVEGAGVQIEQAQGEVPQDVNGLLKTVESLRAEVQRKEQYAQFLREYIDDGSFSRPQQQQQQDNFELDDDVIPYAGDVKKMIDAKVNMIIEQRIAQMAEQNVLSEMKTIGEQKRAQDPNFNSRMDNAIDLLRDPAYAAAYNRVPNNASAKIAFLEKIAPFHPNYVAPSSSVSQEALNRIQANASLPQILASVGSAGNTQRSIKDMTDEEFIAYREKQKKEM